jgi:hypothetical protein
MSSSSCSRRSDARPASRGRRLVLLGCLLASSLCSAANWRDALPHATPLGEGDMRWLGLRIYHVTLWAGQRPFQADQPHALQVHYFRPISRQRLVKASMDEMRRLSEPAIDAATFARWEGTLQQAFVDVTPGDELVAVHTPGRGMKLYSQQRQLADIDDPVLARAFFDIWLDADTSEPALRRQLMGASR